MKKKLLSVLLSAAMLAVMLTGCSAPAEEAAPAEAAVEEAAPAEEVVAEEAAEEVVAEAEATVGERPEGGYKFGYTCMDGTNPFFVILEQTIREGVEANGDTLISTDPANDVSLQITQIEDMITQGIDAIFLNPAEAEGILPALDMLKEAGIPIINFDTEVADLTYCEAYVGSDNYNAGLVCGEDLVKKFPNGGPIIVLDSPTMNSVVDRTTGFLDAIEGKGFEVVAQQDAKGNLEVSMGICEDLLQANGDVVAIFGGNDPTALGALAAIEDKHKEQEVLNYGVDGPPDGKSMIHEGLLEASSSQKPSVIGKIAAETAYSYLNDENIEEYIVVPVTLVTKKNLASFDIDGWE